MSKANLILAKGYSKNIDQLKFNDNLNRLQKLADLNTRASTHCLHVSLNFDMTENLSASTLQQIASVYMEKIGFGNQPFLVCQHHDAAHQHVHIVSTNIQKDGKRISMHNLGRVQSEKARKEIEISFGLVKAGDRQQRQLQPLNSINLQKAVNGKMETKPAISSIVTGVVSQYKYASLPELNAILKQYNVIADRVGEDTRMFEKKGLRYSLLDMLMRIKTQNDRIYWAGELQRWYDQHQKYLQDKTINQQTGRYWYMHKLLRRSYFTIKRAMPNMFHYPVNPAIPSTTNGIEGFFSHLKNHLDLHRGLTIKHRIDFIKWYVYLSNSK